MLQRHFETVKSLNTWAIFLQELSVKGVGCPPLYLMTPSTFESAEPMSIGRGFQKWQHSCSYSSPSLSSCSRTALIASSSQTCVPQRGLLAFDIASQNHSFYQTHLVSTTESKVLILHQAIILRIHRQVRRCGVVLFALQPRYTGGS